jgi:hypothetical protein
MYGDAPEVTPIKATLLREETLFGEAALAREIRLHTGLLGPISLLHVFPRAAPHPVPTFIGLNFEGNAAALRGPKAWNMEEAVRRGYGVATACYEELAPDRADAPIYASGLRAISLWAWGMSRIADYLEADTGVAKERLMAVGHSRLGKTALLAAARDTRFALAIPHQSGCGGAAPSRTTVGETVERINTVFPHWFHAAFKQYNANPETLPFDQHGLVACVAPRPVLLTNAVEDTWANPEGQFEVLKAAEPVYRLLTGEGLATSERPEVGQWNAGRLGYWIRPGEHCMCPEDWRAFLDYADQQGMTSCSK